MTLRPLSRRGRMAGDLMRHRLGGLMSRITQCRVTVLDLPQAEAVSSSYATYRSLGVVVVEVECADGVVGQGWTNLIGGGADAVASFIRSELAPSVIGTDPALVRATWEQMYLQSLSRGRTGLALYAISAVDIAIWDLRCRELGAPLSTVLGACRTSVPIYGDGCWVSYSDHQLREAAGKLCRPGILGSQGQGRGRRRRRGPPRARGRGRRRRARPTHGRCQPAIRVANGHGPGRATAR